VLSVEAPPPSPPPAVISSSRIDDVITTTNAVGLDLDDIFGTAAVETTVETSSGGGGPKDENMGNPPSNPQSLLMTDLMMEAGFGQDSVDNSCSILAGSSSGTNYCGGPVSGTTSPQSDFVEDAFRAAFENDDLFTADLF